MRPIPGPGTGPSSFLGRKDWQKPEYIIQYPVPAALAQGVWRHSAQTVHKNLSTAPGPAPATGRIRLFGPGPRRGLGPHAKITVRFREWGFRLPASVDHSEQPGHSEFRRPVIAAFQPSRNRRQPPPVPPIPYASPPLKLVSQVAVSRHRSLTQSVRCPGPVEGDFLAIQPGNGPQSATCA